MEAGERDEGGVCVKGSAEMSDDHEVNYEGVLGFFGAKGVRQVEKLSSWDGSSS